MSTPSVSKYYNTRKRAIKPEDVKVKNLTVSEDVDSIAECEKVQLNTKTSSITKTEKDIVNLQKRSVPSKTISRQKKTVSVKKGKSVASADKKSKGNQPTLAAFFTSDTEELKATKTKKVPKKKNTKVSCFSCVVQRDSSDPETTTKPPEAVQPETQSLPQSPKRNLPTPPDEEGTPSKKKHLEENISLERETGVLDSPKQKETARRKLQLDSLPSESSNLNSPNTKKLVFASPKKDLLRTPDKLDALIEQSRSKLLLSPRLGELRKSLALFSEATSKTKEFQSNPCRINAVISTSKSPVKAFRPLVFASERFSHLAEPDSSSLILPFKYKLLLEMFRSMDTVVGMMNNRKEKITFDKVKEGVQKIMKRNFTEKNLGQIVTILPTAYNLSREKCSHFSKKINSLEYQLVISPNLTADEDSNRKTAFIPMNPPCLISRTSEFNRNLLELTKKHHQDFLTKQKFFTVPTQSIKRWHPNFLVDSVPDVPVAPLPESPEMKIYTAKDVLNKFKGSNQNKVGKALQSVVDESEKSDVTLELKKISNPKPETSKKELKGICSDLLEKIRARESAKHLKIMTQSPAETKRLAMEERVPKIVNILWHYFIAERKAAIPIDSAVEKIIHSFNSLSTPDDVKEHLKLIAEKFPGWLKFTEVPKGVYITLDKKRNINEMLDKAGLH